MLTVFIDSPGPGWQVGMPARPSRVGRNGGVFPICPHVAPTAQRWNAVLDALVVAAAIETGGSRIVTSDPDDLRALAADHPEIAVLGI